MKQNREGSPWVVVRTLGPRHVEDVSPSELAELMSRTQVRLEDEIPLFKAVLGAYGLGVLFPRVQTHLRRSLKIARMG